MIVWSLIRNLLFSFASHSGRRATVRDKKLAVHRE